MSESKIKAILLVVAALFISIAAVTMYHNRGHVIFIEAEQIKKLSQDDCRFVFSNKGNLVTIHVKEGAGEAISNLLNYGGKIIQIHAKSSNDILPNGEVKADVWVDGKKAGCQIAE